MFQVDRAENRLKKLEEKRFADLQLRERGHLQEWLANMPAALGEELLIIQKEFDGFDDTRERLDLLALDKEGQLVVIENKLDDTGRDVVWQALKYAAYVSSLTKAQIVDIFQAYLDRWCGGGNAVELICEFLEEEALDEVVLNSGNSQRVVLIAANFRKEVTATALWLLGHGIRVQCFKVTPYAFGAELLLDVRQIIPVAEAAEFMIGISSKENEERSAQGAQKERHGIRYAFWQQALEALRQAGVPLYQNISPSQDHWLSAGDRHLRLQLSPDLRQARGAGGPLHRPLDGGREQVAVRPAARPEGRDRDGLRRAAGLAAAGRRQGEQDRLRPALRLLPIGELAGDHRLDGRAHPPLRGGVPGAPCSAWRRS